jgi:chaperonin GroES
MNLKPLDDRLIIEPLASETTTAGGILLPDSAQEKPLQGRVVAAGPGSLNDDGDRVEMNLSKGDVIVYGKYAGTDVKVAGKDYKIMRERDVLAKILS